MPLRVDFLFLSHLKVMMIPGMAFLQYTVFLRFLFVYPFPTLYSIHIRGTIAPYSLKINQNKVYLSSAHIKYFFFLAPRWGFVAAWEASCSRRPPPRAFDKGTTQVRCTTAAKYFPSRKEPINCTNESVAGRQGPQRSSRSTHCSRTYQGTSSADLSSTLLFSTTRASTMGRKRVVVSISFATHGSQEVDSKCTN